MQDYQKYIEDLVRFKEYCTQFRNEDIELKTDIVEEVQLEDRTYFHSETVKKLQRDPLINFIARLYKKELNGGDVLEYKTFSNSQIDFLNDLHPEVKKEYSRFIDALIAQFESGKFSGKKITGIQNFKELISRYELYFLSIERLGIEQTFNKVGIEEIYNLPLKWMNLKLEAIQEVENAAGLLDSEPNERAIFNIKNHLSKVRDLISSIVTNNPILADETNNQELYNKFSVLNDLFIHFYEDCVNSIGKEIKTVKSTSTNPKDKDRFGIPEIALKLIYEGKTVPREEAKKYLIGTRYNSGDALYNKIKFYEKPINRTGYPGSKEKFDNQVERLTKVIDSLDQPYKEKAITELKILKGNEY